MTMSMIITLMHIPVVATTIVTMTMRTITHHTITHHMTIRRIVTLSHRLMRTTTVTHTARA